MCLIRPCLLKVETVWDRHWGHHLITSMIVKEKNKFLMPDKWDKKKQLLLLLTTACILEMTKVLVYWCEFRVKTHPKLVNFELTNFKTYKYINYIKLCSRKSSIVHSVNVFQVCLIRDTSNMCSVGGTPGTGLENTAVNNTTWTYFGANLNTHLQSVPDKDLLLHGQQLAWPTEWFHLIRSFSWPCMQDLMGKSKHGKTIQTCWERAGHADP